METTSCFSYFYSDVIDSCSTLPLCVFFNRLCLVYNLANNASPFCFSSRYGKIVSTKAIMDKTTNKCKGVWSCLFLSNTVFFFSVFLLSIKKSHELPCRIFNASLCWKTITSTHSHKTGSHPVCEFYLNIKSFSSYAVVSDAPGKSGNRQPGCLKLPPSSCYFKPQPSSVGVSLTAVSGSWEEMADSSSLCRLTVSLGPVLVNCPPD